MFNYTDDQQANMVYQEDLDKLTTKRVAQFINHHKNLQQPRLLKLASYYSGRNVGVLEPQSRRRDDGTDERLTHPFAQEIADFQASFSVGNPINIDVEDVDHETLDQVNKTNDVDTLFGDLFLDNGKFGKSLALVFREDGEEYEKMVRLDPINTFMIYNTAVDYKPVMAVRYVPVIVIDNSSAVEQVILKYNIETWTENEHIVYQPQMLVDDLEQVSYNEYLTTFPVVEFWNNSLRLGDYENVLSLIDAYDKAQSDTANYMTDLNDAMLVIKGDIDNALDSAELMVDPDDKEAWLKIAKEKQNLLEQIKKTRVMYLKSGVGVNGSQTNVDAGFIHKEYDVDGVEKYKDRLYKNIHSFARTPDVSDDNFAGNASGVAMKYKQLGVIQLAKSKRRMFEKGLYNLYRIVESLEHAVSGAWNIDTNDIKFTFHDNYPTDDIEDIQALVSAGASLPQAYLYKFLPNVSDVNEIMDMMNDQRESENSEANRLAQRDVAAEADDGNEQGDDVPVQQATNQS